MLYTCPPLLANDMPRTAAEAAELAVQAGCPPLPLNLAGKAMAEGLLVAHDPLVSTLLVCVQTEVAMAP